MPDVAAPTLCCPTCRARQDWTDTCRRCKCDLRLLRAAHEAYERNRAECLAGLQGDKPRSAMFYARQCEMLQPGDESRRLLAVCALVAGDWPTALSLAERP